MKGMRRGKSNKQQDKERGQQKTDQNQESRGEVLGKTHVDRADEKLGPHHDVNKKEGEEDRHDPRANEAFDRLLGRQLDELGAAKGDAADVRPDVVGDDEGGREEEPDHALEDVVHDEVRLDNDEIECHVSPGKVRKLELVVSSLERGDEEDEACEKIQLECQHGQRMMGQEGETESGTDQRRRGQS